MKEFSRTTVHRRRRVIADIIKKEINLNRKNDSMYGGIKENFWLSMGSPFAVEQFIADKPAWEIPFFVIAHKMNQALPNRSPIDHAWWLRARDEDTKSLYEPWGFVTEPYISIADATILEQLNFSSWGVEIKALPTKKSAWNPGSTIPVVTFVRPDNLSPFLKFGVQAALDMLSVHSPHAAYRIQKAL